MIKIWRSCCGFSGNLKRSNLSTELYIGFRAKVLLYFLSLLDWGKIFSKLFRHIVNASISSIHSQIIHFRSEKNFFSHSLHFRGNFCSFFSFHLVSHFLEKDFVVFFELRINEKKELNSWLRAACVNFQSS